jgi:hypothetical protein
VILNTPVARRSRPGTGQSDRHFDGRELDEALTRAGLGAQWKPVRRGRHWWLHQAKALLRGHERFSFPLIVADKP